MSALGNQSKSRGSIGEGEVHSNQGSKKVFLEEVRFWLEIKRSVLVPCWLEATSKIPSSLNFTQSNLQIRCNPNQITNGILHRTRTKNFTICMEAQKTPNSQGNLEKEKWSWRNQAP